RPVAGVPRGAARDPRAGLARHGGAAVSAEAVVLALEAVLIGMVYVSAARRVPRWPRARTATFLAGVAVTFVTLGLPDEDLRIHMVQHLTLALVAAPLLVAGSPIALA